MRLHTCFKQMGFVLLALLVMACSSERNWEGKYSTLMPRLHAAVLAEQPARKLEHQGKIYAMKPQALYYELVPVWLAVKRVEGKLVAEMGIAHVQTVGSAFDALPKDTTYTNTLQVAVVRVSDDTLFFDMQHGPAAVGFIYRSPQGMAIMLPGGRHTGIDILNPLAIVSLENAAGLLAIRPDTDLQALRKQFITSQLESLRRGEQLLVGKQAPYGSPELTIRYLEQLIASL